MSAFSESVPVKVMLYALPFEFNPSKVLYECDRTAYDEGFNDYREGERERIREEAWELVAEDLREEGLEVKVE